MITEHRKSLKTDTDGLLISPPNALLPDLTSVHSRKVVRKAPKTRERCRHRSSRSVASLDFTKIILVSFGNIFVPNALQFTSRLAFSYRVLCSIYSKYSACGNSLNLIPPCSPKGTAIGFLRINPLSSFTAFILNLFFSYRFLFCFRRDERSIVLQSFFVSILEYVAARNGRNLRISRF